MKAFIKALRVLSVLFICCMGAGIVVSRVEKKNGWVKVHKPHGVYEKYVKRPLDFSIALFALVLLWPVLLFISIMVITTMGSPVFFKQDRPGLGGKVFKIYKFRTMSDEKDSNGVLLPDEERITKCGLVLRKLSLDELSEVINILKGDLALVGPRSLLVEYLDRYSTEQAHRHDVRPGLTGYAQTEGRNLCSWEDKFRKDVEYVNNISFLTDLKIIIKTVGIVIKREGISSENSATMEEFTGNK